LNADPPTSARRAITEIRECRVVNSALWAAAGDALGWITELSRGPSGVAHRTGTDMVHQTIRWQRNIGGRNGPRVDLPAGAYSDDTQLRLAVSRSIRGDGFFDAETFAKIEVTVWPTYALGGGLGTKAAATNLARRSVNWFSNFFDTGGQKYVNGGGNGAAMRVQPHVWAALRISDAMSLNVLRDSLATHGHPHGFCGAIFHALCVGHALHEGRLPTPAEWKEFIESFAGVERLIGLDPQLAAFWQSAWENDGSITIGSAIAQMRDEARRDLDTVVGILDRRPMDSYRQILNALGCLTQQFRGAGFKTALAAAALTILHRDDESPEAALVSAANELESDTDTIGTMAGAIFGCVTSREPEWAIQDRDYIVQEARRLAAISVGRQQDSFNYPDLGHWNPPTSQTASVGLRDGHLAIAGLGRLEQISKEYRVDEAIWQWFSLPFGQRILAKRKANLKGEMASSQLPGPRQEARSVPDHKPVEQQVGLPLDQKAAAKPQPLREDEHRGIPRSLDNLDAWTAAVIQSDFDDLTLGRLFNRSIEYSGNIEAAAAFAAIIAKAKLTRQRRGVLMRRDGM
jgi:ADP-ribosylglycohydrolase